MKEFLEDIWYYVYKRGIRRLIPKYHDRTIFTKFYWRTLKDRKTKGFDETETWGMDYSLSKLIAPRLKMFIEELQYHKICANYCHDQATEQLIKKGYAYDNYKHRFKNKNIEKKEYDIAFNIWNNDLMYMYEAFQDIIEENDNWDMWIRKFDDTVKYLNKRLNKMKTEKEKKKYWDTFGFWRDYRAGIQFSSEDFSYKMRKEGLKLFSEHFQSLWW